MASQSTRAPCRGWHQKCSRNNPTTKRPTCTACLWYAMQCTATPLLSDCAPPDTDRGNNKQLLWEILCCQLPFRKLHRFTVERIVCREDARPAFPKVRRLAVRHSHPAPHSPTPLCLTTAAAATVGAAGVCSTRAVWMATRPSQAPHCSSNGDKAGGNGGGSAWRPASTNGTRTRPIPHRGGRHVATSSSQAACAVHGLCRVQVTPAARLVT